MPNYNFRCELGHIHDFILSYDDSIKPGIVCCPECGEPMTKYFGKDKRGNSSPMVIVPIGKCGNSDNGYTAVSNVQKDRDAI